MMKFANFQYENLGMSADLSKVIALYDEDREIMFTDLQMDDVRDLYYKYINHLMYYGYGTREARNAGAVLGALEDTYPTWVESFEEEWLLEREAIRGRDD